jgi:hypothetical protein
MRAALRIQLAEHATRQRLHSDDLFANSTLQEEPDLWRQ